MNTPDIRSTETPALRAQPRLRRRQLMAASTGLAAASMVGPLGSSAAAAGNGVLIPPGKRGIILYTVRDAICRDPLHDRPALGLQGGLRGALADRLQAGRVRRLQPARQRRGRRTWRPSPVRTLLRRWLDDNGLEAEGNHGFIPGSAAHPGRPRPVQATWRSPTSSVSGHMGTGNDPTSSAYKADWDIAAEKWNILGARALPRTGSSCTRTTTTRRTASCSTAARSTRTARPTRSSGIRKLEYFLEITDPKRRLPGDGHLLGARRPVQVQDVHRPRRLHADDIFDPLAVVRAQSRRFPLFHAKDGKSTRRPRNGYDMVPFGTGDIDYATFFQGVGAKGSHNPMYEQDNAPGGTGNPGQSLQFADLATTTWPRCAARTCVLLPRPGPTGAQPLGP